jgi:hypothetical protein
MTRQCNGVRQSGSACASDNQHPIGGGQRRFDDKLPLRYTQRRSFSVGAAGNDALAAVGAQVGEVVLDPGDIYLAIAGPERSDYGREDAAQDSKKAGLP